MKNIKLFFSRPDWMLHKGFFALILSLPLLYAIAICSFVSKSNSALKELETETIFLEKLAKNLCTKKNILQGQVDHDYIKTVLEKSSLLCEDKQRLESLCASVEENDLYTGIKQRLSFLQSGENKLHFFCEDRGIECVWKTAKPVQMSQQDITNIVAKVEGDSLIHPNRPNIFFSSIKIKQLEPRSTDVFTVEMQILQKR